MTILLTGAQGQLGRAVADAARRCETACRALGRAELNITDPLSIANALAGAKIVINAAAYTNVDGAESEPEKAFAVNRDAAGALARACGTAGIPLIHISTDFVFDGTKHAAYVESDPTSPISVYGRSKAEGEAAVREATPRHVILRTAWVFGRHGRNFVHTLIAAARRGQTEFRVVDDQRGCPTATDDIAAALLKICDVIAQPEFNGWGVYHFCGTPAVSRLEFAREILAGRRNITIAPAKSAEFKSAAARPANAVLDCRRIGTVFGISPPPWEPPLRRLVTELAAAG